MHTRPEIPSIHRTLSAVVAGLLVLAGCGAGPEQPTASSTSDPVVEVPLDEAISTGPWSVGEQLVVAVYLPEQLALHQPFSYTIMVINTSPVDAAEVVLRERIPGSWNLLAVDQGRRVLDSGRILTAGRSSRAGSGGASWTDGLATLTPIAPLRTGGAPVRPPTAYRTDGDGDWLQFALGTLPAHAVHEVTITVRPDEAGAVERRLDLDYDDHLRMPLEVAGDPLASDRRRPDGSGAPRTLGTAAASLLP